MGWRGGKRLIWVITVNLYNNNAVSLGYITPVDTRMSIVITT